ncbi:MAG: hypothetical protein ACOYZ7_13415 [Chloroflexota bacterium]
MSQMASAWLEILERVFGQFHAVENATPDWLVDPDTGRRFKVDRLYPELGLAIRFTGGGATARSGVLDEIELLEEAARDEVRERLCRQAGIVLVSVDADGDAPEQALAAMRTALSAAARRLVQRSVAQEARLGLLPRIAAAKVACQEILAQVSSPRDLGPFSRAWEDRQFSPAEQVVAPSFRPGMAVRHARHGKGLVLRVMPGGNQAESEIVVQFADGRVETFLAAQAARELAAGN